VFLHKKRKGFKQYKQTKKFWHIEMKFGIHLGAIIWNLVGRKDLLGYKEA